MLDIIKKAAYSHKTVLIIVRKQNGQIVTREVEPYQIRYEKGKLYMYVWDVTNNGVRKFQPSKILRAVETGNSFIPKQTIKL